MPSLSSLLLGTPKLPSHPPTYTFHGPSPTGHIRALNSSGLEVATFLLQKGTITRLRPLPQQQLCSFKRSSLSGSTTLHFPNTPPIKIRESWEGMRNGKDIHTQQNDLGVLKWRAASGGFEELEDSKGVVIARAKLPGLLGGKASPLEVFVDGNVFLLDLVMVSWVVMIKGKEKEDEDAEGAAEIISALAGS